MKNKWVAIDPEVIGDEDLRNKVEKAWVPESVWKQAMEMEQMLKDDGYYEKGGPREGESFIFNVSGSAYEVGRWGEGSLIVYIKGKGYFRVNGLHIDKISKQHSDTLKKLKRVWT